LPESIRELLAELERLSQEYFIPAIDSEDGAALAALAAVAPRGGLVLDLGAGVGYSTAWLAVGAGAWRGRVVAVEADPARFKVLKEAATRISEATGARVEAVNGDALEYLRSLPQRSVSMAFIDIEKHQYREAFQLIAGGLGVPGAILAFHNAYYPRPPDDFFEYASRFEHSIVPTPAGLLVARLP